MMMMIIINVNSYQLSCISSEWRYSFETYSYRITLYTSSSKCSLNRTEVKHVTLKITINIIKIIATEFHNSKKQKKSAKLYCGSVIDTRIASSLNYEIYHACLI